MIEVGLEEVVETRPEIRFGEADLVVSWAFGKGFCAAALEEGEERGKGLPLLIALRRASRSSRVYLCGTPGSVELNAGSAEDLRGAMTLT